MEEEAAFCDAATVGFWDVLPQHKHIVFVVEFRPELRMEQKPNGGQVAEKGNSHHKILAHLKCIITIYNDKKFDFKTRI
jgi:hypothetical protein